MFHLDHESTRGNDDIRVRFIAFFSCRVAFLWQVERAEQAIDGMPFACQNG